MVLYSLLPSMHTPTHKPILLFTTHKYTQPFQNNEYGVCGWKDRCRDGNLRMYCHVSPILFGCFFVEASPTCFCIFVKCFFCNLYNAPTACIIPQLYVQVFKLTCKCSSNIWNGSMSRRSTSLIVSRRKFRAGVVPAVEKNPVIQNSDAYTNYMCMSVADRSVTLTQPSNKYRKPFQLPTTWQIYWFKHGEDQHGEDAEKHFVVT